MQKTGTNSPPYAVIDGPVRNPYRDKADRLACGNRKAPAYFAAVLEGNGLGIQDMRVLPSNADVARWFQQVKANIERHFPDWAADPLEELRVMAGNMSAGVAADKASAYSIIAVRGEP